MKTSVIGSLLHVPYTVSAEMQMDAKFEELRGRGKEGTAGNTINS
jgi:hypothetical protein